ncbi:MAG: hypothetical protein ACK4KW_03860 [Gemmobacter sp.]
MAEGLEPLIHKAAVEGISVNLKRAGLSIGDSASLCVLPDGRIGILALVRGRFLGLVPRRARRLVGVLEQRCAALVGPALARGEALRVRIVGLTPEHLAREPGAVEMHVSIWGAPRRRPAAPRGGAVVPGPVPDQGV